jgi:DNA polymerase-1
LEIRSYLTDVWGAEVTDGIEADDILGIEATLDPECVICSIDKDLNQIPGKHYNWKNDKHYEVSEFEGWYNLYTQALTGDVSDNIPGLPKVGPVNAKKILENDKTHRDLYESVLGAYLKRNFSTEYLVEQMNLLYLWRKMPDQWEKPV